jgi:hydrocephalus-inducing protein
MSPHPEAHPQQHPIIVLAMLPAQVLAGGKATQSIFLVNNEHIPFQYALDKATYGATPEIISQTGQLPAITFEPSAGTVPPNSRTEIVATFRPTTEAVVNFNVVCNVKKKATPITLNAKGEGYSIHETVQAEHMDGALISLAPNAINNIYFGQVSAALKDVVLTLRATI